MAFLIRSYWVMPTVNFRSLLTKVISLLVTITLSCIISTSKCLFVVVVVGLGVVTPREGMIVVSI